jgi:hypothetical protein
MLSKTLYTKNLSKSLDSLKKSLKDKEEDEDFVAIMKIITIILITLFMFFSLIYYSLVYNRFSSNVAMAVLTTLQIISVLITAKMSLKYPNLLKAESMPFHRLWFLFNVILDYIYYPMTIYLFITTYYLFITT